GPGRQGGIATLLFSLLVMILVTYVVLYTSGSVLLEQQIVNNDVRSKHAFEAAEAGIATAKKYLTIGADRDNDGTIDAVFDTNADDIGDSNTVAIGNGSVIVNTTDVSTGGTPMMTLRVTAQGFSDDRTATRTITQIFSKLDPLPNGPRNPLITRGNMVINGSATVTNPEGHSTIWSGGDVDLGSNNSTSTQIADMADSSYPGCRDVPMTCNTVASSSKVTVGLDVVEYDSSLANISPDEMFQSFFGATPIAYRNAMVTIETTGANAQTDVHLAMTEVIWIDGDASLNGGTIGCGTVVTGNNICPDADLAPSIVIIDGNLELSGTPHFYGLLYVRGDIDVTGNSTIHGAILVEGSTNNASGSLDIWFNSLVLEGTRAAGSLSTPTGSWKDF
ncbi:MAG: PilX N-terminal domain-containing pilus assembly protein, partial [Pseudomonadales bacterium]